MANRGCYLARLKLGFAAGRIGSHRWPNCGLNASELNSTPQMKITTKKTQLNGAIENAVTQLRTTQRKKHQTPHL